MELAAQPSRPAGAPGHLESPRCHLPSPGCAPILQQGRGPAEREVGFLRGGYRCCVADESPDAVPGRLCPNPVSSHPQSSLPQSRTHKAFGSAGTVYFLCFALTPMLVTLGLGCVTSSPSHVNKGTLWPSCPPALCPCRGRQELVTPLLPQEDPPPLHWSWVPPDPTVGLRSHPMSPNPPLFCC